MKETDLIINEIKGLKKELYEIVNSRLENFKVEVLHIIDINLKNIQENIKKHVDKLALRIDHHNGILKHHEEKITTQNKEIEYIKKKIDQDSFRKSISWVKRIAFIYFIINLIITSVAVFLKYSK